MSAKLWRMHRRTEHDTIRSLELLNRDGWYTMIQGCARKYRLGDRQFQSSIKLLSQQLDVVRHCRASCAPSHLETNNGMLPEQLRRIHRSAHNETTRSSEVLKRECWHQMFACHRRCRLGDLQFHCSISHHPSFNVGGPCRVSSFFNKVKWQLM